MTRHLVFMGTTLLLTGIFSAVAVALGCGPLLMTPGSIVVAYAALTVSPIEAALAATLVGFVVDALGGALLGASSFSLLVTLLASRLAVGLVASPRSGQALLFVGGFAVTQALTAMILQALFAQGAAVVHVADAFLLGVLDAIVAAVVFPLLHETFVLLRWEERNTTLRERLQSRARPSG